MPLSPSAHVDSFCRDHLPAEADWPELLLGDGDQPDRLNCGVELVDAVGAALGEDRPCLRAPGGELWSYGDLRRTSNRIARVLTEQYGVVPGNRVLLRGPNNPWLVACWVAVMKAGAVAVATMPLLRAGEIDKMAEIAAVDLALCDRRFTDELEHLSVELRVLTYGAGSELAARIEGISDVFEPVATAADDVALLAFTSGTTGRPKATMHFHRDVLAIADTFSAQVLKPTADDVFTGTPPLAFTFGLGGLVIFPLRVGASTLLVERATPDELAELIAEHQVTICFTAPTAYRAMIAAGRITQLATLRRAVSAGEHLPAATWQAVQAATGLELIDGIGATEMLHIFIACSDGDIRPGSTGRPVPGFVAEVVDDDLNPVPAGEPGMLAVKGPTGCRYLAGDRQHSYVRGGWNLTGDTFIRDADGYFWYQGRTDDMIVSSGYNISAAEVEEALMMHPAIVQCAVVGTPDEARGQIVTGFVVLAPDRIGDESLAREIQDFVKASIAPYKYPRRIEFLAELPKTTTGKVQRFRLRQEQPA